MWKNVISLAGEFLSSFMLEEYLLNHLAEVGEMLKGNV